MMKVDDTKWGPDEWFPEIGDTPAPKRRGVYLKLAHDQWVVCQRPPSGEGRQSSGTLVIVVQQCPVNVSAADVAVLANQTALTRHIGKRNENAWCWVNFAELGEGKLVKR